TLEPSVARKRSRKPARPSGASCRAEGRPTTPRQANRLTGSRRYARKDVAERVPEEGVLLGRADRHADRAGRAEALGRSDHDALPEQLLEHGAPVADVGEEEVAERGPCGLDAMLAQSSVELRAAAGVLGTAPRNLGVVADARKRGGLRRGGHVERAPHL